MTAAGEVSRRLYPRVMARTYLPIWRMDGSKLGNLVNVSKAGCLIFSAEAATLHTAIDVALHVPWTQGFTLSAGDESSSSCKTLAITVCPVWQQRDVHPRFYNLGCEVRSIDRPDIFDQLQSWLVAHQTNLQSNP